MDDPDFASFLGGIVSILCALRMQLQVPLWHSPLWPVGTLGRFPGESTFQVHKVQLQQKDAVSSQEKLCDFHCAFSPREKKYIQRELVGQGD